MNSKILVATLLSLVAFASNSVLCRFALVGGAIDAASFTAIRLASGAIALAFTARLRKSKWPTQGGSWLSGFWLLLYAVAFSYAYIALPAGTGGLILFGTVQFTMIGYGIWRGERPRFVEWAGLSVALTGLLGLVAPGLDAPIGWAAGLMALAGVSWGCYSLRGRLAEDPILATAHNFLWAAPLALLVGVAGIGSAKVSISGILLAVVSGAITSGLGYVLWYSVLPHLTAVRASIAQLAVPGLVAVAGVAFLGEVASPRLILAAIMMLGGVGVAVVRKQRRPNPEEG
ncbi:MAG: DMT family transporter [Fimbriimonadaceae bacterium]|nr:DMT family transporter [Fimbriimonadaceae bacterium]